jgi:dephospho-CoA kinase
VVAPGTPGLQAVVERFGPGLLLADGQLDRKALGRLVFASSEERRALEKLLHPLIWQVMAAAAEEAAQKREETVFEIPLLFENANQGRFSTVWVVTATPQVQLRRLTERDALDPLEAQARIDSQMSVAEKAARADFVIVNDGDREGLRQRLREGLRLWRENRAVPH